MRGGDQEGCRKAGNAPFLHLDAGGMGVLNLWKFIELYMNDLYTFCMYNVF